MCTDFLIQFELNSVNQAFVGLWLGPPDGLFPAEAAVWPHRVAGAQLALFGHSQAMSPFFL